MCLYANISKLIYISPYSHLSYKGSILYRLLSTLLLSLRNEPGHCSLPEHGSSSLSVNDVTPFHCTHHPSTASSLATWWLLMLQCYTQSFHNNAVQMLLHYRCRCTCRKNPPERDCCPWNVGSLCWVLLREHFQNVLFSAPKKW